MSKDILNHPINDLYGAIDPQIYIDEYRQQMERLNLLVRLLESCPENCKETVINAIFKPLIVVNDE